MKHLFEKFLLKYNDLLSDITYELIPSAANSSNIDPDELKDKFKGFKTNEFPLIKSCFKLTAKGDFFIRINMNFIRFLFEMLYLFSTQIEPKKNGMGLHIITSKKKVQVARAHIHRFLGLPQYFYSDKSCVQRNSWQELFFEKVWNHLLHYIIAHGLGHVLIKKTSSSERQEYKKSIMAAKNAFARWVITKNTENANANHDLTQNIISLWSEELEADLIALHLLFKNQKNEAQRSMLCFSVYISHMLTLTADIYSEKIFNIIQDFTSTQPPNIVKIQFLYEDTILPNSKKLEQSYYNDFAYWADYIIKESLKVKDV